MFNYDAKDGERIFMANCIKLLNPHRLSMFFRNILPSRRSKLVDVREFYRAHSNLVQLKTGQGTSSIPRQVFQTWKSPFFDKLHAEMLAKLQEVNSDFCFYFYDDEHINSYMRSAWGSHPIYSIFERLTTGAARADVWRYCILYEHGGVYLDIDSSFSVPISEIIGSCCGELLSFEQNYIINAIDFSLFPEEDFCYLRDRIKKSCCPFPDNIVLNWAMFFSPRHPILARCINLIVDNASRTEGVVADDMLKMVLNLTGPIAFTRSVWEYAVSNPVNFLPPDFAKMAIFKEVPPKGVYMNDSKNRYTERSGSVLLLSR